MAERKMWDLSTAHLTPEDDNTLAANVDAGGICEAAAGWLVFPPDPADSPQMQRFKDLGLSETLLRILREAAADGIFWVYFSFDGPIDPDYPTFDW